MPSRDILEKQDLPCKVPVHLIGSNSFYTRFAKHAFSKVTFAEKEQVYFCQKIIAIEEHVD